MVAGYIRKYIYIYVDTCLSYYIIPCKISLADATARRMKMLSDLSISTITNRYYKKAEVNFLLLLYFVAF